MSVEVERILLRCLVEETVAVQVLVFRSGRAEFGERRSIDVGCQDHFEARAQTDVLERFDPVAATRLDGREAGGSERSTYDSLVVMGSGGEFVSGAHRQGYDPNGINGIGGNQPGRRAPVSEEPRLDVL